MRLAFAGSVLPCARRGAFAGGACGARPLPCSARTAPRGRAARVRMAAPPIGGGERAGGSALRVVPDARDNQSLWTLALCGALYTVSNLMVVSILPLYMKGVLGLSSTKIGALEGAAIAAAFASKVFSGVVSDALGSRVRVILVGAAMTAAVKPMFACAGGVNAAFGAFVAFQWIFCAKVVDRLSKGVRAAPTDALLADLSPGESRNRAYSLVQALATLGGMVGSLACSGVMYATGNAYRATFLMATVPAMLAIVLLVFGVKQPARAVGEGDAGVEKKVKKKVDWRGITKLSPKFFFSALVVSVLYVARFSESFVMLRARSVGTALTLIPLLATANQLVQGMLTYPMGLLADLFDERVVLVLGWLFIILAHIVFFSMPSTLGSVLGFVLVGIHMSMTQANTKSMISQNLAPNQRGTGFAVFGIMSGIALAAGNVFAGWCNDVTVRQGLGMVGCFYSGAFFSTLSLVLLLVYFTVYRKKKSPEVKSS